MAVVMMNRTEALGWVSWAVCHRDTWISRLTIDQLKEGAEQALMRAKKLEDAPRAVNREHRRKLERAGAERERRALVAEHSRRSANNVALVVALDTLGFDTAADAALEFHEELGLGVHVG